MVYSFDFVDIMSWTQFHVPFYFYVY